MAMADTTLTLDLNSDADTALRAVQLGRALGAGDTVLLNGSVGAGKTFFARALVKSLLLEDEDVPSPTFTLVQTYDTRNGDLWHADLYRISSDIEIEELGLSDAMKDAICLIEWPDRLGDYAPADALNITLSPGAHDDARQLTAHWMNGKWNSRLKDWHNG